MQRLKDFFNKICKTKVLIMIVVLTLILSIGIPSLARYRNRVSFQDIQIWDGTVALQYKQGTGTEIDPYIISNGAELAYFYTQLEFNDYSEQYFELSSDIALNDGFFKYVEGTGITYIKEDTTYYVDPYTGEYYTSLDLSGTKVGDINLFNPLDNFKGTLNGNSYTIYGLYIASNNSDQLALFTNLSGTINDLYVENALIYGGFVTGGIASKSNNALINNVVFNGSAIGLEAKTIKDEQISLDDIEATLGDTGYQNNIDISIPFITGEIATSTLTGTLTLTNSTLLNTTVSINGVNIDANEFTIDLEKEITDTLTIEASTTDVDVEISLTNLSYNINYEYANAGGIVAEANNTTISNCVNKGKVYSNLSSGGLVGVQTDTIIINSYNTGTVISNKNSAGLVGKIVGNVIETSITNSYNIGNVIAPSLAGFVHTIEDSSIVTIINSFNATDIEYGIRTVIETPVTITNSYLTSGNTIETGTVSESFVLTTIDNLYSETFMKQNLYYNEFIDKEDILTNVSNVWIYEDETLPRLYIDEEMNIASIHAGTYTWDSLSYELETVQFNTNIKYMITSTNTLRPVKEMYYYVHNDSISLTKSEIEAIDTWNEYTNLEEIKEEGFYILYAKVIDYNDNVTYLNSDLLVLDMTQALVNITLNDNTWNSIKTDLDYLYLDRDSYITVEASDLLSGVASVKYYISNQVLTTSELDAIAPEDWILYESPISIKDNVKKIIYVKATDNCNFITYANTDFITLDGYIEDNITIGRGITQVNNDIYVTDKSTITLGFSYSDTVGYEAGYTHNLMSNILLPINTKITLIDKNSGNIYTYIVDTVEDIFGYDKSCDTNDSTCTKRATYPLSLFKNMKISGSENFDETNYYSTSNISEKFKVVIDFSNTSLSDNYDGVLLYMALKNKSGNIVRTTLNNTIDSFNVYSNIDGLSTKATLYLNTDYSGTEIIYNSDSTTNINISTGFNYKTISGNKVYDTVHEDKNIGIAIKLLNSNNEIVDKKYLKNFYIRIGSNDYAADSDGIFRINLGNGIENSNISLSVVTNEDNMKLANGDYSLNITSFVAYDGLHATEFSSSEVSIPVIVSSTYQSSIEYNFDVMMDDTYKIINKSIDTVNLDFNIIQSGALTNPNIKVLLYQKSTLTAYNQDYTLVNLQDYVSNSLIEYQSNIYYAVTNPLTYNGTLASYNNFRLSFINSKFDYTGYKLVFELYDGDKRIGTIEKNFIVK